MIAIVKLLGGVRATIFACAALAALAFAGLQTYKLNSVQMKLSVQTAALAISAKEYAEYKLEQTKLLQSKLTSVTTTHLQEKANAKQEYDRTIANLRTGNERLRERFTCPAPGQLPASPASGSDGGTQGGLLREDAEFLIGEAARADEVVRQLQLAQKTLKIYQEAAKNE